MSEKKDSLKKPIHKRVKNAARLIKNEGGLSFTIKSLQKVEQYRQRKSPAKKKEIGFLAKYNDVLRADWYLDPYQPAKVKKKPPFTVNWVISPPDKGIGGGHQNIFRFIHALEKAGHDCHVYLYSGQFHQDADDAQKVFRRVYPESKAEFSWLDGPMRKADAVFATGWETAYPVFNDPGKARKFYFVQDFEPTFYPLGSEYILAENTYRFNFFGITAGGWLAKKLKRDYGMQTDHYDFGAEKELYRFENTGKRKEIFFYARPVTARRGFELGIMALQRFHEKHPDYVITLAGWDVSEYKIPFPYQNLKTLTLKELSDVYNRCAAALVVSLTNMSLLPLELLACGTIPVVNDGENNREVSDNPHIKYAPASPGSLAAALSEIVTMKDLPKYAARAADSVTEQNWEISQARFEEILRRELNG